jgi:RNA polymerase sigma-70 factor (ECF subfamily)
MDAALTLSDWSRTVEALYRQDSGRLWRAICTFAGDPEIASEAVADAYAQAIRRGPAVHDPRAWVWRAAFRIAAGQLKERRAGGGPIPEATRYSDRYEDADLHAALRQLPDAQRAAIILYYYADLPVREIALHLGSNSLAVRANLSRGRRRLHALLGTDHD